MLYGPSMGPPVELTAVYSEFSLHLSTALDSLCESNRRSQMPDVANHYCGTVCLHLGVLFYFYEARQMVWAAQVELYIVLFLCF